MGEKEKKRGDLAPDWEVAGRFAGKWINTEFLTFRADYRLN